MGEKPIEAVSTLVEETVKFQLQQVLGQNELTFTSPRPTSGDGVFGHWMAILLMSGPAFRLTVKIHYNSKKVRELIALSEMKFTVTDPVTIFMREFGDSVAKTMTASFSAIELTAAYIEPIFTRGFDEVFSTEVSQHMTCEKYGLTVSHSFELLEKSAEEKIQRLNQSPNLKIAA